MSTRTTRLVIERELRESARRKSVWGLVGVILLGSTAMVVLPSVIPDGDDDATVVIVGDDSIGLTEALDEIPDPTITVEQAPDLDVAAAAIEDGDADLAVVLAGGPDDANVVWAESATDPLVTTVGGVVADRVVASTLAAQGIDLDDVSAAFAAATPQIEVLDKEQEARRGAAFAMTLVLYLITVILTSQVASAVAVEKSNRVSEVLLAIVPPRSMLYGKVIGVVCLGMVTLLAGALPVLVRYLAGGDLPENLGQTLIVSGVWFLGGLALYLTIAGAAGAMVARQEEVGAVITPLTLLLVVGYVVSISAGDTVVGAILGYFPLTSPMVEPYRIAIGAGSPFEYVGSLVLLLAAIVIVSRSATVVFRRAIVRTGKKLRLRDLWQSGSSGPVTRR